MSHPKITDEDYNFVQKILDTLIEPHRKRMELGKKRQHQFNKHEQPDKPPLIIDGCWSEEIDSMFPEISPLETNREFFRILCHWLQLSASMLQGNSDWQPFVYAQFGTAVNLACIGLEPPIIKETASYGPPCPLDFKKAADLSSKDISIQGTFAKALDFIVYVREITDDRIDVLCPDLQSPFDLACMIMGEVFFIKCIEDKPFIHQFLEFCTDLFCKSTLWGEELTGSRAKGNCHVGGGVVFQNRACAISVDHAVMFSPNIVDEFVIPSSVEVAKHLNATIKFHFCGWYEHLSLAVAKTKELEVLNQGIVPGKEHDADFELVMKMCADNNTLYNGAWPILPNETVQQYIDRLYKWAKRGILLPVISFSKLTTRDDNPFITPAELYDYWQQK